MNKKLLIAVGVLTAAVCAIGVIGSGAWFTDSEKVEVEASSAKLDVQLDVCGPGGGTADGGIAVAWPISGLAPGQMQSKCIHIQNKAAPGSTLPVKYRYRVANIDGDPADVASLNIHAYRADCSLTGPATFVYDGPLAGMDGSDLDWPGGGYVGDDGRWDGPLPVGGRHCYWFEVYVPDSVGNEFQASTVSFDIVGDATQEANPGWSQTTPTTLAP